MRVFWALDGPLGTSDVRTMVCDVGGTSYVVGLLGDVLDGGQHVRHKNTTTNNR